MEYDYGDPKRRPKLIVDYNSPLVTDLTGQTTQEQGNAIYPNPVVSELFIAKPEEVTSYAILDTKGSEILKGEASIAQIDLSHLEKGIYVIQLKAKAGTSVHKFVKL